MPMLDGAPGIQDKRKIRTRLLRKSFPFDREQPRFSIFRREMTVGVKPRGLHFRGAGRIRPLNPAVTFDELVIEPGVIAEASRRNVLPLLEGIFRLSPSRKQFFVTAKLFCEVQKYLEVRAGLSRRVNGAVHLAYPALRICVRAFFFTPDGRWKNEVRNFACGRGMKSILHDKKIQAV